MSEAKTLTVIQVDRVKPIYPDWIKKVIHPELELVGPTEFDLIKDLELWLHPNQKDGVAIGNVIYGHLKDTGELVRCLNLQDLLAIQHHLSAKEFSRLFGDKALFGWGSVVQGHVGSLSVPCLCVHDGEIVLDWGWLGHYWLSSHPALRRLA